MVMGGAGAGGRPSTGRSGAGNAGSIYCPTLFFVLATQNPLEMEEMLAGTEEAALLQLLSPTEWELPLGEERRFHRREPT